MPNQNPDDTFTDLEIRIFQAQEDNGYPVEITLGGQQEFPRGFLAEDIVPWQSGGDLVEDGQHLFDALFADNTLRSAWAEARGQCPQRRIRLRIDPTAPELHTLPWELLQENQVMLSASGTTPFSRYLPIALPWGGLVEDRPIRVLVVISNPDNLSSEYDLAQLDVDAERAMLETGLADLGADDVELVFMEAPVTLERLEQALHEGYHILHYIGHGAFSQRRGQAALYLQDDAGNTQVVPDNAMIGICLLYTSPSPRDRTRSRMPSSA